MIQVCLPVAPLAELAVPVYPVLPAADIDHPNTPQVNDECFEFNLLGASPQEAKVLKDAIETICNESPIISSYIASAFTIQNFTIAICNTKIQTNVLGSYDYTVKTLRLPKSIFNNERWMETLRHEFFHAACHARYIANNKNTYASLVLDNNHTYPFQNQNEEILIKRFLSIGQKRVTDFIESSDPQALKALSIKIENLSQEYQLSYTKSQPQLSKTLRALKEAQAVADSPKMNKFFEGEKYPEEQFLSEQLAHFFGRVPSPIIEKLFPELIDYVAARVDQATRKNIVLNSIPFQPHKSAQLFCEHPYLSAMDAIVANYKITPNADNLDLFFDRVEILFKGSIDNLAAREELKNNLNDVLSKGLIASSEGPAAQRIAIYRFKSYLYLAGIAVLDAKEDTNNVEKWTKIARLYKRAEKELKQQAKLEANPFTPEFMHDNFYAYSLYISGSQNAAETVNKNKPFTPK